MKALLWTLILGMASLCYAQTPAPTCTNEARNFVFEAVVAGVEQQGIAPPYTSAWSFGGSVRTCNYWPSISPGNSMKWRTGPPLSVNQATGEGVYGPCDGTDKKCGLYWHVDNYGLSQTHLQCSTSSPCTYSGKWTDVTIALDPVDLAEGKYTYVVTGHANGTYCSPRTGCVPDVEATYVGKSLAFAGPFLADNSFGGGAFGGADLEFELSTQP